MTSVAEEEALLKKIKAAGVQNLARNQHSVHVLIAVFNKVHHAQTEFIVDYIEANFLLVNMDKHGICLVKAALNKASCMSRLEPLIVKNVIQLAKNAFGNFSVQILLS